MDLNPVWLWHWLGYWTGVANESGKGYGFWSGIGSCLTYATAIIGFLHHKNCHAKGCWRLGKHPTNGGTFVLCAKHHPDVPRRGASVEHIHAHHEARRSSRPAA